MKFQSKIMSVLIFIAFSSFAQAQTGPVPTDPSTGIDVVKSAINQVKDELIHAPAGGSQIDQSDYLAWNQVFQVTLNKALDHYEYRIENELLVQVKPYLAKVKLILMQTALRDDQKTNLLATAKAEFAQKQQALAQLNFEILSELFHTVFSFLPTPAFDALGETSSMFGHKTYHYQYQVHTFAAPDDVSFTKEFKSSTPIEKTYNATYFTADMLEYYTLSVFKQMDISREQIYQKYFLPYFQTGCKTQFCENLKQADLLKAYESMANKLGQYIVIPTGNKSETVWLGYSSDTARMRSDYHSLLADPIVDPSLPFSI